CEQSAGCTGCTGAAGVCGKSAAAANLQDELTGSLIGLARAAEHAEPSSRTHRIMTEGLLTTITNVNFNEETLRKQVETVRREKELLLAQKETNFIENATTCHTPSNPDVNIEDYDMKNLWNADEDIRSLKSLILFGLRGMAAYAYHAMVLGYTDD